MCLIQAFRLSISTKHLELCLREDSSDPTSTKPPLLCPEGLEWVGVANQRMVNNRRYGLSALTERASGIRMQTTSERTVFLRLSPDGSRADLPRYPYQAYYSVLSIPRPCAALLQAAPVLPVRTVNTDKCYPRTAALTHAPGRGSSGFSSNLHKISRFPAILCPLNINQGLALIFVKRT